MAFISSAGLTTSFRARALPAASTCSTAKQGALTMSDGTVSTSVTRRAFLSSVGAMALWCASGVNAEGAPVQVEEVTPGKGVVPVIGDLVGIRFRGSFNGVVFDNLFDSKEPYFYRVGSTNVLPGIDEVVQNMNLGQVVNAILPPEKAFGTKGRRASPGKPSIPGNAVINYTIELSTIPGKEAELIEGVDDSELQS